MGWLDRFRRRKQDQAPPQGAAPPGKPSAEPATMRAKEDAGGTILRGTGAEPEPAPTLAKVPVSLSSLSVGDVVADTYEIKQLLSVGGMGVMYLAYHRHWKIDVALKVPSEEVLADPELRQRILIEAKIRADLGMHPNIEYCYCLQPIGDALFLVLEGRLSAWRGEAEIGDILEGDHLGEGALVHAGPRRVSVRGADPATLGVVTCEAFIRFSEEWPELHAKLLRALLRETSAKMRDVEPFLDTQDNIR